MGQLPVILLLVIVSGTGLFAAYLLIWKKKSARSRSAAVGKTSEEILRAALQAQEEERNQIGSELHSVGAILSGIKMSIQVARQTNTLNDLNLVISQIDETISQVRGISYYMVPFILNKYGLERAIEELINQISYSWDVDITFNVNGYPRLIPENQLLFYRIIQEVLYNSVKHFKAKEILIELDKSSSASYRLTVKDNGTGLPDDILNNGNENLLMNIRSRALVLKSDLLFSNNKSGGAQIILEIPQSIN